MKQIKYIILGLVLVPEPSFFTVPVPTFQQFTVPVPVRLVTKFMVPLRQQWANDTYRINSWRSASILLICVMPPGFGDFRMARRTITANSLLVTFPTRAAAAMTLLSSFLQTNFALNFMTQECRIQNQKPATKDRKKVFFSLKNFNKFIIV